MTDESLNKIWLEARARSEAVAAEQARTDDVNGRLTHLQTALNESGLPSLISRQANGSDRPRQRNVEKLVAERRARLRIEFEASLHKMGIPQLHAGRTEFRCEPWLKLLEFLKSKCGHGLMVALIGDRGRGKTQMAVEVIRHAARLKYHELAPNDAALIDNDAFSGLVRAVSSNAIFCETAEAMSRIRRAFDDSPPGTELELTDEFRRPQLLVLDEVQESLRSDWERVKFTQMMNKRYEDEKDTLLIGNLTEPQCIQHIGSSVHDRIIERGGIIECDWPSFREAHE